MSWPPLNREFLADAGATYNYRLGLPTPLAITRDGAVLFRRTPPREFVADLYELDTRTGAVKTLATAADLLGTGEEHLSNEEKARRERSRTAPGGRAAHRGVWGGRPKKNSPPPRPPPRPGRSRPPPRTRPPGTPRRSRSSPRAQAGRTRRSIWASLPPQAASRSGSRGISR